MALTGLCSVDALHEHIKKHKSLSLSKFSTGSTFKQLWGSKASTQKVLNSTLCCKTLMFKIRFVL